MSETTDLTLPQITSELRAIALEIIENGGEVDDETDERHDELVDLATEKTEAYIAVINELRVKGQSLKEVENHYRDKRRAVENTVSKLKDMLLWSMQAAGDEVRETDLGTVRVQTHHTRPLEVDVDPEELPEGLRRVRVSADNSAIRDYLEEHGIDRLKDGDRTLAHLGEASVYVRIY